MPAGGVALVDSLDLRRPDAYGDETETLELKVHLRAPDEDFSTTQLSFGLVEVDAVLPLDVAEDALCSLLVGHADFHGGAGGVRAEKIEPLDEPVELGAVSETGSADLDVLEEA